MAKRKILEQVLVELYLQKKKKKTLLKEGDYSKNEDTTQRRKTKGTFY